ncbi:pre-toxin TG domain-containing protein [Cellulomonas sp. URHB0016]
MRNPRRPGARTSRNVRRALRVAQLACGVWTTTAVVSLLTAAPAAADNCSAFTDCFGVANSAVEAAFGLSLLAVLSMVLDFVPFVGTGKGAIEAVTGRDLLTGQELAPWERALGIVPFLASAGVVAGLARHLDDLPHAPRVPDAPHAADVPHHTPPAPPRLAQPPPVGRTYAHPPEMPRLVTDYGTATRRSERARISEQLGELGARQYLRDVSGDPNLALLRPTSPADVADLVRQFGDGEPWDVAVAFSGKNVTNVVHFDGSTLHVVEAKGGGSGYADRQSVFVDRTRRIDQTDPLYPRDVADSMQGSAIADGRQEIGSLIEEAYSDLQVRYVGVRTGPYAELLAGNPTITVEKIFLEPPP